MTFMHDMPGASEDPVVRGEGFFARAIRLWLEHHHRMYEFGLRPL